MPAAAIAKQQIHTTGLTASQAIQIVKNQTIKVNHKAIIHVHTQIIFARKGRTFAIVSMNLNIIANPQYIKNSQRSLRSQVMFLLACCACKNISSADTFHCSNREMLLPFETV